MFSCSFSLVLSLKQQQQTYLTVWGLTRILILEHLPDSFISVNKANDTLFMVHEFQTSPQQDLGAFYLFLNLFLGKFLKLLGRWNGSRPGQTSVTKVLLFLKYVHGPALNPGMERTQIPLWEGSG